MAIKTRRIILLGQASVVGLSLCIGMQSAEVFGDLVVGTTGSTGTADDPNGGPGGTASATGNGDAAVGGTGGQAYYSSTGNGGVGGTGMVSVSGDSDDTSVSGVAIGGYGGISFPVNTDGTWTVGAQGNGGPALASVTDTIGTGNLSVSAEAQGGIWLGFPEEMAPSLPAYNGGGAGGSAGVGATGTTSGTCSVAATAVGGEGLASATGGAALAGANANSTGGGGATAFAGAYAGYSNGSIGDGPTGLASANATAISFGGPASATVVVNGVSTTGTAISTSTSDSGGDAIYHGGIGPAIRFGPADGSMTGSVEAKVIANGVTIDQYIPGSAVGTLTAYVSVTNGNITLNSGGTVDNEGTLTLSGAGSATMAGITGSGALVVGVNLTLLSNTGVSTQGSIQVNSGSALDIKNNTVIINYGSGADPISSIISYLYSGYGTDIAYGAGSWTGTGIISSSVAYANTHSMYYNIGYADGADGVVSGLSSGQIEIMPTLCGDATLSGTVDFGDYEIMSEYYGSSGGWDEGNWDYGSVIDFGDYALLSENIGKTDSLSDGEMAAMQEFAARFGDTLVANPGGTGFQLVSVPEPTSSGLLGAAAWGLVARRRRAKSHRRAPVCRSGRG